MCTMLYDVIHYCILKVWQWGVDNCKMESIWVLFLVPCGSVNQTATWLSRGTREPLGMGKYINIVFCLKMNHSVITALSPYRLTWRWQYTSDFSHHGNSKILLVCVCVCMCVSLCVCGLCMCVSVCVSVSFSYLYWPTYLPTFYLVTSNLLKTYKATLYLCVSVSHDMVCIV